MARRPSRSSGASRPLGHRVLVISAPKPVAAPAAESSAVEDPAPAEGTSSATTDFDINNFSLAELTMDTPLIPFNPRKLEKPKPNHFLFLALPSELRVRIYQYYFDDSDKVLDLSPDNYKRLHNRLGIFRVCRQVHDEVTHYFYSTRFIRIFPIHHGRYLKTKKPLLARLKPNQRNCLNYLELRLGPGWNAPPRSWVVNDALGLADCVNVHRLRVFVEFDPSHNCFKDFRRSEGFYENFTRNLFAQVLEALPAVRVIEFDGWSSVKKSGGMMSGLLQVANEANRTICWGPERGWTDGPDDEEDEKVGPTRVQFVNGRMLIYDHTSQNVVAVA